MLDLEEVKSQCVKHFLVPFEGTGPMDAKGNFLAYLCPAGIPTIAWGITFDEQGKNIKLGDVWSYDRAVQQKSKILTKFLNDLLAASPILKNEPVARVAAILSWVFNLGIGNYRLSTFRKRIEAGDWIVAAMECRKWDKAKVNGKSQVLNGLTKRREKESLCILLGSFEP